MSSKIKKITLAVITLITPFLLSYKAIAVELSQSVQFQGSLSISSMAIWQDVGTCTTINQGTPYATNNGNVPCTIWGNMVSGSGTGFNTSYIWGINVYLYELRDREAIHGYINQNPQLIVLNYGGIIDTPSFIGHDVKNVSESSVIVTYYFKSNTTNSLIADQSSFRFYPRFGLQQNEFMMIANEIEVWAMSSNSGGSVDNQGIINAIRQAEITNQQWLQTINTNLQSLIQNIQNNQSNINNINNNIQESIDKTEEAAQEGEDNAEQGQTDTEQASTNIIGIMGNVVGAFNTGARSNCQLNMNLGNIDFGRVDFCSGKPNAWQQILGGAMSIVLVYVVYRVAKNVFNVFMSAMVFAQGGNRKDG